MMKWALIIAVVLTVGATAGMATAFDFSSVSCPPPPGTTVCEIGSTATSDAGFTPFGSNINFLYADFGDAALNGTAQISPTGVDGFAGTGGLGGALELMFSSGFPTAGIAFSFNVGPAAVYSDGAFVTLYDSGHNTIVNNTIPTDSIGSGSFFFSEWPTATISQAEIFFTADLRATSFHLFSLEYDVAAPEPGTFALTGSFLFLLGFGSRKLLKRRS